MLKTYGINRYDGSTDPNEFIKMFKCQALMFNWTDEKQASILELLVVGKAERAFNELSEDDKKVKERIFAKLKEKCVVSTESLFTEFTRRRPRVNESFAQFASALQEL